MLLILINAVVQSVSICGDDSSSCCCDAGSDVSYVFLIQMRFQMQITFQYESINGMILVKL